MKEDKYTEEFETLWGKLDKEELKNDPKKIEFVWKSTIESNSNIETELDRDNSKATVLLTVSVLLMGFILSILMGIIFESKKIISLLDSILSNIDWLSPKVVLWVLWIFVISLLFSFTPLFFASMFFVTLLAKSIITKNLLILSPSIIFSDTPYDDNTKAKIRMIPTLEKKVYKKFQFWKKNRNLFMRGTFLFQTGAMFFLFLFILLSLIMIGSIFIVVI